MEGCRVHALKLIPADIWRRIVHLLGQLDGGYTERLGIDRSPDRTAAVLFEAQEALMVAARSRRRGLPGHVVPLVPPPSRLRTTVCLSDAFGRAPSQWRQS